MKKLTKAVIALKIWKDKRGQDLIEYALMAGFVAVAAGALMPSRFEQHQHCFFQDQLRDGGRRSQLNRRDRWHGWEGHPGTGSPVSDAATIRTRGEHDTPDTKAASGLGPPLS